jgi:gluconolactonase
MLTTWRSRWAVPLIVVAVGLGLLAGYVRWGRPLALLRSRLSQLTSPPGVSALRDARPAAVIDLMRREGTSLVKGQWRYAETPSHRLGKLGVTALPDTGWIVIDPGELDRRRRAAPSRFKWYRLDLTIPDQIGDFDARGSAVLFEVMVDGYAELWLNGTLSPVLGQNGGSLISRYNGQNRMLLTRDARGQRFELTLRGVESLLGESPADGFSIRSATLDFVPPPPVVRPGVGEVVRLDPGLDTIVSSGERLQKIADGVRSGEGPVWMPEGYLLFSDFQANLIYRWTADDGLTVFRTKSGYAGFDIAAHPLPGSNGLAVDREGRLTIAEHGRRRVVRLERNGDVTVLADAYRGRRLNSPNDLVYKSDGSLYFTDPPYGLSRSQAGRRELPYSGVFRWLGGRLELLTSDLIGPNGLAFSPDERHLYVADSDQVTVMRYEVRDDGTLANGRRFFKLASDGLKVDRSGNLYAVASRGEIWVISAAGKAIGMIRPPERANNLAWGDEDYRTLYVVGGRGVYRIRLEIPGSRPWRDR